MCTVPPKGRKGGLTLSLITKNVDYDDTFSDIFREVRIRGKVGQGRREGRRFRDHHTSYSFHFVTAG